MRLSPRQCRLCQSINLMNVNKQLFGPARGNLQINYENFPDELLTPLEIIINRHLGILPDWCRLLTILWDTEMPNTELASMNFDYAYRWATLRVGSAWVERNAADREQDILHEFFHVQLAPLGWAHLELERVLSDTVNYKASVNEQFTQRMEMCVCDLTRMYLRIMEVKAD